MEQNTINHPMGLTYITTQYTEGLNKAISDLSLMNQQIEEEYKSLLVHLGTLIKSRMPIVATLNKLDYPVKQYLTVRQAKPMTKGIGKRYILFATGGHCYEGMDNAVLTFHRIHTLHCLFKEFTNLRETLGNLLYNYKELSVNIEELHEIGQGQLLATHLETSLHTEVTHLNELFGEVNSYTFLFHRLISEEKEAFKEIEAKGKEDSTLDSFLKTEYSALIEKRSTINRKVEERTFAMIGILREMRKDIAKVKVHTIEDDVLAQRQQLRQYKEEQVMEDIKDYTDLDGSYRHKYDEEGNLIETEEYEEGGRNNGLKVIIGGILVVAIIVYFFIRQM